MIAVAAFASIATSAPSVPLLGDSEPLERFNLEPAVATKVFAIQIQHLGEPPLDELFGNVLVRLQLETNGPGSSPSELRVALAGDSETEERTIVLTDLTQALDVLVPAWTTCTTSSTCVEDYTLTLTRVNELDGMQIEVSGEAQVSGEHDGEGREETVTIEVTPL
ncbi:MAG: hypothetical protein ABI867_29965 [Kofleriaceae bacterium]